MSIQKDSVVTLHYTLKDDAGEVIDSSDGGEPLAYCMVMKSRCRPGARADGQGRRDKLNVKVTPADGYGEHDAAMVQRVPRRQLMEYEDLRGMNCMRSPGGPARGHRHPRRGRYVTIDAIIPGGQEPEL